tara:strand:+ start:3193 stop:6249 length:3057 start_codon:yes stop_codon:yes gene_type:complete
MEIYKYKIWTGNIPGSYTKPCEDKKLVGPLRNVPSTPIPISSDCQACNDLGNAQTVIDYCLDCYAGSLNACCPDNNTNCCGLIIDDCEQFYALPFEKQNDYCLGCNDVKQKSKHKKFTDKAFPLTPKQSSSKSTDPNNWCKCCNRAGRDNNDSQLAILLDQDLNDIGHYSMWDGEMEQQDTFSNFTVIGDTINDHMVSLRNSTEFRFFKFLEDIQYTVDWGDPLSPPTTVTAPLDTVINIYTNPGVYTINVRMSGPWGTSSVSHQVAIPFQTGAQLWAGVANTGQTYTFTPPGFSTPVSMDYETSDWGPLDSGLEIDGYLTSNYGVTPYPVEGVTDSMISSLQSYNSNSDPGLPPGYTFNTTISVAGESLLPDGTYVDNLQGHIQNVVPTGTAYTITNGTEIFDMFDHVNGITTFVTQGWGMSIDDFLTRKCGYSLQGACDVCNGDQIYYLSSSYITQSVTNDRGVWDVDEEYEPMDYVFHDGCCYFAISVISSGGNPPDLLDVNSTFWRVCQGSCVVEDQLPSRYNCIDGTCVLISPTSTYYNNATFVGSPQTTANALSDCVNNPCTPTSGPDMHYECDEGACVQVSPLAGNYGTCTYQGATALTDCQVDVLNGDCTTTNIQYNCVFDSTTNTSSCQPTPSGFYPDLGSCNDNCGGSTNVFDWYCVDNSGTNSCQGVQQIGGVPGPIPGNATTGIANATFDDCQSDCLNNLPEWFCMCNTTLNGVQVPLTSGTFGGQYCVSMTNSGVSGGFGDQLDCEQNCLSWECDEVNGDCTGYDAQGSTQGSFCAENGNISGGGTEVFVNPTPAALDIEGCNVNCEEMSSWMCIGGDCTQIYVNSSPDPINPLHVAMGGTLINYTTMTAILDNCDGADEIACNSSLLTQCGQGCGPCAANPSSQWPFTYYDPAYPYLYYDVTISAPYGGSTNPGDSQFKYYYDPSPVCDDLGTFVITSGPWVGIHDCGVQSVIDTCQNLSNNGSADHPCTVYACNTPPLINETPPNNAADSKLTSGTCWAPCDG